MSKLCKVSISIFLVIALLLCSGCEQVTDQWTHHNYRQYRDVDFKHYPLSQAVARFVESLELKYPALVRHEVFGYSVLGKPLSAVTITNSAMGSHLDKPAFLIIGQQHAREPIGSQVALYWLQELLSSYGKDEIITHLLDTRTIYLLPQVNPDGNDVFLTSDNSLRTNLRPSDLDNDGQFNEDPRNDLGVYSAEKWLVRLKYSWVRGGLPFREGWNHRGYTGEMINASYMRFQGFVDQTGDDIKQVDDDRDGYVNEDYYHGVDLNRNWDFYWLEGSTDKFANTYKGPEPWSEPEAKAMRDFILACPNIMTAVDLHSGVEMLLYPWGVTDEAPIDEDLLQNVARTATSLTQAPHTQSAIGLYFAYGGAKDWLYSQGILALTAEVFRGPDVFSYTHLGMGFYQAYRSLAHQFNPDPEKIGEVAERWAPLLTYMLSITPAQCVADVRYSNGETELELKNTGYLKAPLAESHVTVNGSPVPVVVDNMQGRTVMRFPLLEGQAAQLTLSFSSSLSIAERSIPPMTIFVSRQGGETIVEGHRYEGPSPSTLFPYGYIAPKYPWGTGEWYLQSRR